MASRSTRSSGNYRTSVVSQPLSQNFRGYPSQQQQQQQQHQPAYSTPPKQNYGSPPAKAPINSMISGSKHDSPQTKLQWQAPAPGAAAAPAQAAAPEVEAKPMETTDGDTPMDDASANGAKKEKPAWLPKKLPKAERKKRNIELSNRRMRRAIAPKNAIVVLQEVCPFAVWNISECPGRAGSFAAEVKIGEQKFHGVGAGKSLARAAASELALQSFVKEPVKVINSDGTETLKDETPWGPLASFALHKLFCGWKRGEVGTAVSLQAVDCDKVVASPGNAPPIFNPPVRKPLEAESSGPGPAKMETMPPPKKQRVIDRERPLPENALLLNPVAVLFQMRPDVKFQCDTEGTSGLGTIQQMTAVCDEKVHVGRGRSRKIAKREAAKLVLKALYDLDYPAEEPVPSSCETPKQIATTYGNYL